MIVVLNNKSNLEKDEFIEYLNELKKIKSNHKMVLCPSQIYLTNSKIDNFELGCQNVSAYKRGAYTGEVYAKQLKDLNVSYCIVGHSERRKYQRETNNDINKKIKRLLEQDITPILCVGETNDEKTNNQTTEVILKELKECLSGIDGNKVIIAYEPIWAIGTGLTPTKVEIEEVLNEIKKVYLNNKLIYGGSLNQENVKELKNSNLIDGYLLGGLSLKPKDLEMFLENL